MRNPIAKKHMTIDFKICVPYLLQKQFFEILFGQAWLIFEQNGSHPKYIFDDSPEFRISLNTFM